MDPGQQNLQNRECFSPTPITTTASGLTVRLASRARITDKAAELAGPVRLIRRDVPAG